MAIREGEGLGARPELARTYAELAVRLRSAEVASSEPDEGRSGAYLEKAKALFRDMGLNQELQALEGRFETLKH